MKRLIFSLTAICFITMACAQAQFGVKAGVNVVNEIVSGAPAGVGSITNRTDFHAGLLASIHLFSRFYLQPEILYSGQGGAIAIGFGSIAKLEYSYLNVPVLFKYQHTSGLFAESGPQVGLLLAAKQKANGLSYDTWDNTRNIDFSWAFDLGYKLPFGLGIDARYNLGLTNLNKNNPMIPVKNSVLQFGLFYLFSGK